MTKKQAKFFCENCGEEVAQNARFCKKCGRFFSAVRCPKCGKVGSSHTFINGCPSCGYAVDPSKNSSSNKSGRKYDETSNLHGKNHFYMHKPQYSSKKQKSSSSNSLPLWIYCITLCAFVGVIILFIKCSY